MGDIRVGSMQNSAIQQDSPGAVQNLQFSTEQQLQINSMVEGLLKVIDQFGLNESDKHEVVADAETVKTQLKSSKPKWQVITACLGDIRKKLMEMAVVSATPHVIQHVQPWIDKISLFLGMG